MKYPMYQTILVAVKPNSTIEALIRFYNNYNIDKPLLRTLVEEFNRLNPHACPPKAYMQVEIPILPEYLNKHKMKENTST